MKTNSVLKLNLPEYALKIVPDEETGRRIYDRLRRKWVALTPEEWVRQNFVEYLINDRDYPAGFMANEVALRLNGTLRRSDTVVFDRSRRPSVIVEYKAPSVEITQRVFDQIVRYNMALQARYLIVSNGLKHYCCRIDEAVPGGYTFLREVPHFATL